MDTPDEQADQLAALVEAALPDPELTGPELPPDAGFIVTKEHRRFAEFAAAVRRDTSAWLWPARRRQDSLRPPLRVLA